MKHQTNPAIAVIRLRTAAKWAKYIMNTKQGYDMESFYSRRFKI